MSHPRSGRVARSAERRRRSRRGPDHRRIGVTPLPCPDCSSELRSDCDLPMTICFVRECTACTWEGVEQFGQVWSYPLPPK